MQRIGEDVRPISNFRELTFAYYKSDINLKIFEEVFSHLHINYKQDS